MGGAAPDPVPPWTGTRCTRAEVHEVYPVVYRTAATRPSASAPSGGPPCPSLRRCVIRTNRDSEQYLVPPGEKVCYGRWEMNHRIAISAATVRRTNARVLRHLLLVVATLILCSIGIGCNQPGPDTPSTNYSATVEAMLPTADPTVPPTPTPTPTSIPPTDTPAPTFTPRPRPTYTPWPTPTKATTEDRQPAIPFNAQMLDGSEFSLPDAFGSPTLLAFFAPW